MPRTFGLSGPSHANGQDRKPTNKTDISATFVKDRNYLNFITSVDILNVDNFCRETPCDNILLDSTRIWYFRTCNIYHIYIYIFKSMHCFVLQLTQKTNLKTEKTASHYTNQYWFMVNHSIGNSLQNQNKPPKSWLECIYHFVQNSLC